MGRQATEGAFTITLRAGSESGDYTPFITHLKTLSPSTADLEIRSLSPDPSNNEQLHFVHALASRLKSNRDFDVVQAWMAVFLRLHVESLMIDEEVRDAVREWKEVAEKVRVAGLAGYSSGVFAFLRSAR